MAIAIAPIHFLLDVFFLDIRAFVSRTPLALLIGSLLVLSCRSAKLRWPADLERQSPENMAYAI